MKSQKKLLLALMAVGFAGAAQAKIEGSLSGNGELFLNLYSKSSGISFTADLLAPTVISGLPSTATVISGLPYTATDVRMDDFQAAAVSTPGTKLSWDMNVYPAWAQFKSSIANATDTKFDLKAMDETGTGKGDDRFMTTSSSSLSTIKNQTNTNLVGFNLVDQDLLNNGVSGVNKSQPLDNDASVHDAATGGQGYFENGSGDQWKNKFTGVSTDFVTKPDGSMNWMPFYMLATSSGVSGAGGLKKADVTQYGWDDDLDPSNGYGIGAGMFGVDMASGTLYYNVAAPTAVIPVPAAVWLLGSGLIGLVGVARRRRSA